MSSAAWIKPAIKGLLKGIMHEFILDQYADSEAQVF